MCVRMCAWVFVVGTVVRKGRLGLPYHRASFPFDVDPGLAIEVLLIWAR